MFRYSQRFFQQQRTQAAIEETRQAIEREKKAARRWRQRNPNRKPKDLLKLWEDTKQANAKKFSEEMVRTMAFFDGISEANKTMRFGLEAPDAAIDLQVVHDLMFNTFNLRLFEILADHYQLSDYSRQSITQTLINQIFKTQPTTRARAPFAAEVVGNVPYVQPR